MKKDVHLYINDMLDAITLVGEYVSGMTEVEFSESKEKQDAVIHRLMIIGEAAGRVPEDIRKVSPDTQWRAIVAFRNVAIHEYSGVSLGRVWEIVQQELPPLMEQLKMLRSKLGPHDEGLGKKQQKYGRILP